MGLHPAFSTGNYTNMFLGITSLSQIGGVGQIDPSPVDTAAGFADSYDFDNDGTFKSSARLPAPRFPLGFSADGPDSAHCARPYPG